MHSAAYRISPLVTADARLVTASPTENADLFWALRGAGGNFGAVVSLEYRLYPTTMVLSGLLLFPMDHARAVLRSYDEFIKSTPDELTVLAGFLRTPDGMPVVFLSPVYCGSFEQRERVLAPLRTFAKPLADPIRPLEYAALISSMSAMVPKGRHYCIRTQTLPGLCRETIELLIEQANQLSSPFSVIVLDHFHGAASRVGISETAFSLRQDHLLVEFIAGWEPRYSEEDQKHTQWAQRGSNALAPYALPGGYINLLDQAEEDRVPLAYGSNYARLLSIKKTYDPDDVFHSTIGHISPGSRPASSTTSQSGISELRFPLGT
jgi:FAD/FMN-containing dehydrogenase